MMKRSNKFNSKILLQIREISHQELCKKNKNTMNKDLIHKIKIAAETEKKKSLTKCKPDQGMMIMNKMIKDIREKTEMSQVMRMKEIGRENQQEKRSQLDLMSLLCFSENTYLTRIRLIMMTNRILMRMTNQSGIISRNNLLMRNTVSQMEDILKTHLLMTRQIQILNLVSTKLLS